MKKKHFFSQESLIKIWHKVKTRLFRFTRRIFRKKKKIPAELSQNPIGVYQMGRVGSISIRDSLRQAYEAFAVEITILHGHYLNNFEELKKRAEKDSLNKALKYIDDVEYGFRKVMQETAKNEKIKLVSLVRDPVARNVSTFFYALDEFIPNWEEKREKENLSVDVLQQIFLDKQNYALTAFYWFEEQMMPVFDIDIYATPFPKEKGYEIYSSSKADLLILRLESLNNCAQEAFDEFLGIPDFKMSKVNTGESRKAGELYQLFKGKPLPREYVEWSYSFKLANHFYTNEEIEFFIKRWTL